MERNEKCFCGSGKKYKKCHCSINETSKAASVHKANAQYDVYADSHGVTGKCVAGCNTCCRDYFYVSEIEFLVILERILTNEAGKLEEYVQKANVYADKFKGKFPEEYAKLEEIMEPSGLEGNKYFENRVIWDTGIECIFIDVEGKCTVYPNRPCICRLFGQIVTCNVIDNDDVYPAEREEIFVKNTMVRKGEDVLLQRPFPLFYWFCFFLDDGHRKLTLDKARRMASLSEEDFYDYKMELNRHNL